MEITKEFWSGKRVLLTGHTGFKGSWMSLWLSQLGAEVHGLALDPPTDPNLFLAAGIGSALSADHRVDIVEFEHLKAALHDVRPEIVFHMAAQPLVRESYADPLRTFAVNVMGTANLLEVIRGLDCVRAVVVITTDKCYDNREWVWPYREIDALGGHDPYSASKAGTEIVTASYRKSFFANNGPRIASVRAGNVIGGGDWADDRLVPDCIRAFQQGEKVVLRYPGAVRPWQHVLDPLAGYLKLARQLSNDGGKDFSGAWNFGPDPGGEASVLRVAKGVATVWGNGATVEPRPVDPDFHEAALLRLDSTKARTRLDWAPKWQFADSLTQTVDWYRAWNGGQDMAIYSQNQIKYFMGVAV